MKEGEIMYTWNPVYSLTMQIKQDYINKFRTIKEYNLEKWINELNIKEYNDIFECLQFNQYNEFVLIRYGLAEMQEGMWSNPNSIYRECRSVVIDLKRNSLVTVPFRKFFNLNEVEENSLENIKNKMLNAKLIEVSDKLDGSMHCVRWYNDEIFYTGSMALDEGESWRLVDGKRMLTENYVQMAKKNPNFTFIFEYISLKDAHVVLYDKSYEGLYLIGVRDTTNGKEFNYKDLIELAKKYNIKYVNLENKTIEQLLVEMKNYKSHEKEGWVLNIDGHKVKIKCDDYVYVHRVLDKVSSVNVVIQSIADNKYDDLISKIPDKYRERVNCIAREIFNYIKSTEKEIVRLYNEAPKNDRKEFMIWVDENVVKNLRGYVRSKYLNKEYNLLKKKVDGYKKLNELGIEFDYSALFNNGEG